MSRDFDNRAAFVAGASAGIGAAASKMLLARRARVALHYRSRPDDLVHLTIATELRCVGLHA
jgi:NAD(P)-dependent dehydrogenase (short-subunit alcohol dehydrogenase family)